MGGGEKVYQGEKEAAPKTPGIGTKRGLRTNKRGEAREKAASQHSRTCQKEKTTAPRNIEPEGGKGDITKRRYNENIQDG